MMTLFAEPVLFMAAALLLLALLSQWLTPHREVPATLALLSMGAALYGESVTMVGVATAGGMGLISCLYGKKWMPRFSQPVLFITMTTLCVAGFCHLLPGYDNWQILAPTRVSAAAPLYGFYFNFDKGFIGFILCFFLIKPAQSKKEWARVLKGYFFTMPLALLVLIGVPYAMKWIVMDLKWPHFIGPWLVINLLNVCLAEEVVWRGFVQREVTKSLGHKGIGLLSSTILFISVHAFFIQDWPYLAMIGVASLLYGLVYQVTERIETAVLVHFTVNAVHMLCWTYPRLLLS